jgi:hypothetical protein
MALQWTESQPEEISVLEQCRLTEATVAYFHALPRLHRELINELSMCRRVDPIAVMGQALADGLERMVDEARVAFGDMPDSRPVDATTPWPVQVRKAG